MSGQTKPAVSAVAVTPNDTTDFYACRALYIGSGGDIKVDMAETGTAVIFKNLLAGTVLSIAITRVYSTDTTASDIVRLF